MDKGLKHDTKLKWILIVAILCCVVDIFLFFYLGYTKFDLKGHWRICAYTLHGYNPFPLIGQKALIPEIGKIPPRFSTVPWECVLGNVFFAGFLPLKAAAVYNFGLHFAVFGLTARLLWKEWGRWLERTEMAAVLLLIIGHFSFMYSLRYGNNGAIICMLLIDAILIARTHPWICGVLLGICLMKPQISAILCLAFLLKGWWKPLIPAAAVTAVGFWSTSVMTATSIVQLIKDFLGSATASELQYIGLFTFLTAFGVDKLAVMLINMVTGILYTVLLFWILEKYADHSSPWYDEVTFVPACIASTFWIYKNGPDYQILSLAAMLLCLLLVKKEAAGRDWAAGTMMILYLLMSRCLVYIAQVLISREPLARALFKGADGLMLAVIGFFFCRMWIRYEPAREERRE